MHFFCFWLDIFVNPLSGNGLQKKIGSGTALEMFPLQHERAGHLGVQGDPREENRLSALLCKGKEQGRCSNQPQRGQPSISAKEMSL
ncbi:MAG: hypothetical protein C0613_07960 [Desulfobulbaceae bacterium]|nr:MAG: hypothetical protein C0613_07960 [Desulfobulbaceae bacterium]